MSCLEELQNWTNLDIIVGGRALVGVGKGLAGSDVAVRFSWPLADGYGLENGAIHAVGGLKEYGRPLLEPDLFSSLARLGEDGDPSERQALRWVGRYGLLTSEEGREIGDPIALEDFGAEAHRAHRALALFDDIRTKRHRALRARTTSRRIDPPRGEQGWRPGRFADVYVDGIDAGYSVSVGHELADEQVLSAATHALERLVRQSVTGDLEFGADFGHPHPLTNHRPVLAWVPRDLLSALWLQFALDISDARPWRTCGGCGRPFLVRRKDQRVCAGSEACRKRRQRRRDKAAGSTA